MNRRAFLAASAATTAALLTSKGARAVDEPPGWADKLHLMDTWFWLEKEIKIPEQTAILKKLGFGGLALTWGSQERERLAAIQEIGFPTPGCFITAQIEAGYPDHLGKCVEMLKGTQGRIWLALTSKTFKRSDPAGDEAALKIITQCADACKAAGTLGIALYPHISFWQEKTTDAVRLAALAKRADVGLQFNQYHWMATEGGKDLKGTLEAALPYLKSVSVNGSAALKTPESKPTILPLGEGDYEVLPILKTLRELKFEGAVSHQGYSIQGNIGERLASARMTWEKLTKAARE